MKKDKNFFYKIIAADFLAEVFQIPEGHHKEWLSQFALHLVAGDGNSKYAQKLIDEADNYRIKQAEFGSRGGKAKHRHPTGTLQAPPTYPLPSSSSSTETKDKIKRFIPPSLHDVETYIKESGLDVDANKWINYYTANGWKVGKNPMKDWKAAVRTWAPKKLELVAPVTKPEDMTKEERKAELQKRLVL